MVAPDGGAGQGTSRVCGMLHHLEKKTGLYEHLQCDISIPIADSLGSLEDTVKVCLCKGQVFQRTVQWRQHTCRA